jgi:hypothetical protein
MINDMRVLAGALLINIMAIIVKYTVIASIFVSPNTLYTKRIPNPMKNMQPMITHSVNMFNSSELYILYNTLNARDMPVYNSSKIEDLY